MEHITYSEVLKEDGTRESLNKSNEHVTKNGRQGGKTKHGHLDDTVGRKFVPGVSGDIRILAWNKVLELDSKEHTDSKMISDNEDGDYDETCDYYDGDDDDDYEVDIEYEQKVVNSVSEPEALDVSDYEQHDRTESDSDSDIDRKHNMVNKKYEKKRKLGTYSRCCQNNLTCSECGLSFVTRSELKVHRLGKHPLFSCTYKDCKKVFKDSSNRKKHIQYVHLKVKKHSCQFCSALFSTTTSLRRHLYNLHTELSEKTEFPCDKCDKVFYDKNKLALHHTLHTGIKMFTCKYDGCNKTFRLKSNVSKHEKVHANIKPFECDVCGDRFSRASYLMSHMYKHTGVKEYSCGECGKSFSQKGNLSVHMKLHEDKPKTWECDQCHRTFSFKSNFTKHLKQHESSYVNKPLNTYVNKSCNNSVRNIGETVVKTHNSDKHLIGVRQAAVQQQMLQNETLTDAESKLVKKGIDNHEKLATTLNVVEEEAMNIAEHKNDTHAINSNNVGSLIPTTCKKNDQDKDPNCVVHVLRLNKNNVQVESSSSQTEYQPRQHKGLSNNQTQTTEPSTCHKSQPGFPYSDTDDKVSYDTSQIQVKGSVVHVKMPPVLPYKDIACTEDSGDLEGTSNEVMKFSITSSGLIPATNTQTSQRNRQMKSLIKDNSGSRLHITQKTSRGLLTMAPSFETDGASKRIQFQPDCLGHVSSTGHRYSDTNIAQVYTVANSDITSSCAWPEHTSTTSCRPDSGQFSWSASDISYQKQSTDSVSTSMQADTETRILSTSDIITETDNDIIKEIFQEDGNSPNKNCENKEIYILHEGEMKTVVLSDDYVHVTGNTVRNVYDNTVRNVYDRSEMINPAQEMNCVVTLVNSVNESVMCEVNDRERNREMGEEMVPNYDSNDVVTDRDRNREMGEDMVPNASYDVVTDRDRNREMGEDMVPNASYDVVTDRDTNREMGEDMVPNGSNDAGNVEEVLNETIYSTADTKHDQLIVNVTSDMVEHIDKILSV